MQSAPVVALALLALAVHAREGAFPLAGTPKTTKTHKQAPVAEAAPPQPSPADAPLDVAQYAVPKAVATAPVQAKFDIQLPPVANVLSSATRTLESISSEVTRLEAHVQDLAEEDQGKLAKKKAEFEHRLQAQQEQSDEVNATNTEIANDVADLKAKNLALRQKAQGLQKENEVMRHELRDIQAKLSAATAFVVGSLGVTDDHKAKELAVLQESATPVRHPQVHQLAKAKATTQSEDDDDEDSDDGDDDSSEPAVSLLALSRSSRPRGAQDDSVSETLLGTLKQGISKLNLQNKKASLEMDKIFKEDFQGGMKARTRLLKHQQELNATRAELTTIGEKLEKADEHLELTRDHLQHRLRSVGLYLQRLAHLILAPPKESQALIARMPKPVELHEAAEPPKAAEQP